MLEICTSGSRRAFASHANTRLARATLLVNLRDPFSPPRTQSSPRAASGRVQADPSRVPVSRRGAKSAKIWTRAAASRFHHEGHEEHEGRGAESAEMWTRGSSRPGVAVWLMSGDAALGFSPRLALGRFCTPAPFVASSLHRFRIQFHHRDHRERRGQPRRVLSRVGGALRA